MVLAIRSYARLTSLDLGFIHLSRLFNMMWVDERDPEGRVILNDVRYTKALVASGIPGKLVRQCLAAITTKDVKEALRTSVREAVRSGAYGMPFMEFHGG